MTVVTQSAARRGGSMIAQHRAAHPARTTALSLAALWLIWTGVAGYYDGTNLFAPLNWVDASWLLPLHARREKGQTPANADAAGRVVLLRGVNVNQLIDYYQPNPGEATVVPLTEQDYDPNLVFAPHLYSESITMDQGLGFTMTSIEQGYELALRSADAYDAPGRLTSVTLSSPAASTSTASTSTVDLQVAGTGIGVLDVWAPGKAAPSVQSSGLLALVLVPQDGGGWRITGSANGAYSLTVRPAA